MRFPGKTELGAMVRLALPVVIAQVGLMAMGVVDTLMVGRVSAEALAAVALGNLYFLFTVFPASGTLMVLDPIVAQAVGARDEEGVARGIQRGFVLAVALSVLASIILLPVRPVLQLLHQPPAIIPMATSYVLVSILGILPFLGFVVLRQSLQALGSVRSIVAVILVANLLNAFLNWVFVYGHLGSSAMGAVGSAWATLASRWMMLLLLLVFGWRALHPALFPWRRETFHLAPMRSMLHLGLPIGLHQGLELGAFAAIGVLMGVLGTREMAAHQIAINLASFSFMVPLGVGAAAAVRVGHAAGAGDGDAAREAASAALFCGVGFMLFTAAAFLLAPHAIAERYTRDGNVVALATMLIPIAGVFQVFDGIQVVCAGVLRGLGDTKVPFVINLTGFWLVGFPVSVGLGFFTTWGAPGLWSGLVAGLGVVSSLLLWRVVHQLRGPISRTVVEADEYHLATDA
ncbi:MAG: MATE family efflux transporter [Gemmatimonadota bacterium]